MRLLSLFAILLGLVVSAPDAMAAAQAFPPTAPGTTELKTLPAGLLLRTTMATEAVPGENTPKAGDAAESRNYFSQSGRLFRPLFRYIDSRDIAMTTPVEARVMPGEMYFWVAASERSKVDGADGKLRVAVLEMPERRVASRGERGSYSQRNYEATEAKLRAWLAERPELIAAGDAYPVFWDGPFTPWFAKQFEVHLPVRAR
jgi:hypothetical protein